MTISTTGFKGSSKKKLYTLMATVALTTMGGAAVMNAVSPVVHVEAASTSVDTQVDQGTGGYLIATRDGEWGRVYISNGPTIIGQFPFPTVQVPQLDGYTSNYQTIKVAYYGDETDVNDEFYGQRTYNQVGGDKGYLAYTSNDGSGSTTTDPTTPGAGSSSNENGSSSTGTDTTGSSSSSNALTSTDKNNAKDLSSKADSKTPASTTSSATKTSSAKADVQTGVADGMLPTIAAGASSVIAALGLAIRKHF